MLRDPKHGSETSFHEMFAEHAGHVYSTALRCCGGRTDLAQDVTQSVFCEWIRTAATFSPGVIPGGWLHRCTVFKSSEILRSEARRKRHERQAAIHQVLHAEDPAAAPWREMAAVIDETLERLPPADRDAVILRFYERQDFREVGRRLGVSVGTAQKRVERALSRLRKELARRGITSTSGALCSFLGTSLVISPPPGFISSLTLPSLAPSACGGPSAAALQTLTTMTANTKLSILGAGLCATLAITSLLQHHTISNQKEAIRDLHIRLAGVGIPGSGSFSAAFPPDRKVKQRPSSTASSRSRQVEAFAKALNDPDPLKRMSALTGLLQSMGKDEAPTVAELFQELANKKDGRNLRNEYLLFLQAWGGLDGPAAVAFAKRLGNHEEAATAMSGWANRDPGAAIAWLETRPPEESMWLASGIASGWALHDLDGAAKWVETLPPSDGRTGMLDVLFNRHLETRGMEGAKAWFAGISQDPHNEVYRQRAFDLIANRLSKGDPQEALRWLEENEAAGYARKSSAVDEVVRAMAERDPRTAAEWVLAHSQIKGNGDPDIALAIAVREWSSRNPGEAENWLSRLQGTENHAPAVLAFTKGNFADRPESAMGWLKTIDNAEVREKAIEQTAVSWLWEDRQAASRYLLDQGYSQEEVDRLAGRPPGSGGGNFGGNGATIFVDDFQSGSR